MTPRRSARVLAVTAVAALGLLTGCTSHATRCSSGSCTVNLTGAQVLDDVDPRGDWETPLGVGPIELDAVTVTGYDRAARLAPGEAAEVAGLRVQLVSVSGSDVSLRVDRT